MNNLHPMSEKPTVPEDATISGLRAQCIIEIILSDKRTDIVLIENSSFSGGRVVDADFSLLSMLFGRKLNFRWDSYPEKFGGNSIPIGWRYLNEKVKVVWEKKSDICYEFESGLLFFQILFIDNDPGYWMWDIFLDTAPIETGNQPTLDAAKDALLKWYNANLAPLPEVE